MEVSDVGSVDPQSSANTSAAATNSINGSVDEEEKVAAI